MEVNDDWLVRAADQEIAPDRDHYSFEDSERFEDDSECSWMSNDEGLNQNWRGWAPSGDITRNMSSSVYPMPYNSGRFSSSSTNTVVAHRHSRTENRSTNFSPVVVRCLSELTAKACASFLTFDQLDLQYANIIKKREETVISNHLAAGSYIEHSSSSQNDFSKLMSMSNPSFSIPDKLFLQIIYWCFPSTVCDIRLYSCLANGNAEEYGRGESLYQMGAVRNVVQIGYLITAVVNAINMEPCPGEPSHNFYNVSLRVDRCRVVACSCSCDTKISWCQHVVSVCLHRVNNPNQIQYRQTIWDSVNELDLSKLRKFAQYMINELPRDYIPVAQQLLDQLNDPTSAINASQGAPDPTDGGHEAVALWALNEHELRENIRRLLVKYCRPTPAVHCDVFHLTSTQHPIAAEWQSILKPLRSREPEGLWNLIAIVREMMARRDGNSVSLLRIITEECIANTQVLMWWYVIKLVQSGDWFQLIQSKNGECSQSCAQLNCSQLLDEIVMMWRAIALNPAISSDYRRQLLVFLQNYHQTATVRIWSVLRGVSQDAGVNTAYPAALLATVVDRNDVPLCASSALFDLHHFPGFYPALQVCCSWQGEPSSVGLAVHIPTDFDALPSIPLIVVQPALPVKTKKKKKKRKDRDRRGGRRDQRRENRGQVRIRRDEVSSGESGQESDAGALARQQSEESGAVAGPSTAGQAPRGFPQEEVDGVLAAAYRSMDPLDIRFARCEAFSTHGYPKKASSLATKLAEEILAHLNGPDFEVDLEKPGAHMIMDGDVGGLWNQNPLLTLGQRLLDTLTKALYIANVLRHQPRSESDLFAFVLSALQFPRIPMATKFMQVQLYYLESELVSLLQQVPMSVGDLERVRAVAESLTESIPKGPVPPVALTHFVLDRLAYTHNVCELDQNGQSTSRVGTNRAGWKPCDDELSLRVALDALEARVRYSEHDYPMLCEAVRRQKGELAITLLTRHKDSKEKLGLVMDRLLDPMVHRMYNYHQSNAAFFLERDNILMKHCPRGQRPVYPFVEQPPQRHQCEDLVDAEEEAAGRVAERVGEISLGRRSSDDVDSARSSAESPFSEHSSQGASTRRGPALHHGITTAPEPSPAPPMKRWREQKANSVTEAYAHYMTELSKRLLSEAGGNQSTVVFAPIGQGMMHGAGPHRNLHMCAMLVGIYALGVHNKVSSSWHTRTYSNHVSWLAGQVTELGSTALEVIHDIWERHFTPVEVASLADKMSASGDKEVVEEAARLALSVLPRASALSANETLKALLQCREQGHGMTESACCAIEQAAQNDRLYHDVLFRAARYWEELWRELDKGSAAPPIPLMSMQAGIYQQHQQPMMQQGYPPYVNMPMPGGSHPAVVYNPSQPPPLSNPGPSAQPAPVVGLVTNSVPAVSIGGGLMSGVGAAEARLHQSHSAPQLTGARQISPDHGWRRLVFGFNLGLKALDSIFHNTLEETRNKYVQNPMYAEDVQWLFGVACQLGPVYALQFLECAAKNIPTPYLLLKLSYESIQLMKHYTHMGVPVDRMQPVLPHALNVCKVYAQSAVQVRNALSPGTSPYYPITCRLIERCIEQFHAAAHFRLSHVKFSHSDKDEIYTLLIAAMEAYKMLPLMSYGCRNLFDEFLRQLRKLKAVKHRDISDKINEVQRQFDSQPRY